MKRVRRSLKRSLSSLQSSFTSQDNMSYGASSLNSVSIQLDQLDVRNGTDIELMQEKLKNLTDASKTSKETLLTDSKNITSLKVPGIYYEQLILKFL